ncbi:MAG: hypothetical protein V4480_03115 [Patescibacteria group bacterium]
MPSAEPLHTQETAFGRLFNRVPEITVFFWIIKVLGTTVGETAADFLNVNLNLGLTVTSVVMGVLLAVALFFQFKAKRYVPGIYWSAVVLISVFGTLVTDNLTDALGVPLELSTLVFSALLAITFALWYWKERSLSMHSIVTAKRETFYWFAILFTFALGTASGDLMAEGLGLGYFTTGVIVAGAIAAIALARRLGLNAVLSFWLIYILTRPLGASIGDLLTQSPAHGGLGLGATTTSVIFIAAIIATVAYLAITKKDVTEPEGTEEESLPQKGRKGSKGAMMQVVVTLLIIIALATAGYYLRQSSLQAPAATLSSPSQSEGTTTATVAPSPLGNLTTFRTITQDMLDSVNKGDLTGAKTRADDLEFEWDNAEARLKPMNTAKWHEVDDAIDKVLREVRSVNPNVATSKSALEALLSTLN